MNRKQSKYLFWVHWLVCVLCETDWMCGEKCSLHIMRILVSHLAYQTVLRRKCSMWLVVVLIDSDVCETDWRVRRTGTGRRRCTWPAHADTKTSCCCCCRWAPTCAHATRLASRRYDNLPLLSGLFCACANNKTAITL